MVLPILGPRIVWSSVAILNVKKHPNSFFFWIPYALDSTGIICFNISQK